jgi:hypothetical protein
VNLTNPDTPFDENIRQNAPVSRKIDQRKDVHRVSAQKIEELVEKSLSSGAAATSARAELAQALSLDDMNLTYFLALYQQKKNPRSRENLRLFDESHRDSQEKKDGTQKGEGLAYATANAPAELLKELPYRHYVELNKNSQLYAARSRQAALWLKKTQAGGGTSVIRDMYLSRIRSQPTSEVHLGSKGTDLYVNWPHSSRPVSLAELQLLQALNDLKSGVVSEVFFHDIVSTESRHAIHELWKKHVAGHPKPAPSYEELAQATGGFHRFGETFQSLLPTLDDKGAISFNRTAPGGHAFFAVETLLNIARGTGLPKTPRDLVAVIGNGEDLGSTPDEKIIGWMLEENLPLVMITTEKTEIDLKGGQLAIVRPPSGKNYVALIEQAQAKESGQIKLFEDLGLTVKKPGQMALFNTNVALFNLKVLQPKLSELLAKVGEEEFLRIITPTLIENKKLQKDTDGVKRTYEQLEGAMGSTLLNLDRYWRMNHGEPLVHFMNIERKARTRFFSPIKTAFDFFMQFYSDRFTLDVKSVRLENAMPGELPLVTLENTHDKDFYNEVENILTCFKDLKLKGMKKLMIHGPIYLHGLELSGSVEVVNDSGQLVDLGYWLRENKKPSRLKDVKVFISAHGEVKLSNA